MQSSNLIELSPQQPQGRVYTRCFCLEEPLGSVRLWGGAARSHAEFLPWKSPASLFPLLRRCRERGGEAAGCLRGAQPAP